jgi:glycosyltransferase involved in cell wall biosynthesis
LSKKKVVVIRANLLDRETRATKIIKALTDNNYLVTLICWDRGIKSFRSERKEAGSFHKELKLKFKAPWGNKVLFFLPVWWVFVFYKLMITKWDIVHAIQIISLPPAVLAGKLKGKQVIYDMLDTYEDSVSLPKPVRNFCIKIDKLFMWLVDAVILADDEQIEEVGGIPNSRVVAIYDSPETITKIDFNPYKNEVFTLFFAGLLYSGKKLNLDKMFEAIQDIEDVKIIMAGYGDLVDKIKELSLRFPNKIQFIGEITHSEVLERSAKADLLFVLRDPVIPVNKYICGSKIFEAMMCGTPILVNKGTSTAKKVIENNCGIVVDASNVEEIRLAIIKLKTNVNLCKTLGKNAKIAYKSKFDWGVMRDKLLFLYGDLLQNETNDQSVKKQYRSIGIVTKPIVSKGALVPLSNLIDIVSSFSSSIHVITGNEGINVLYNNNQIFLHVLPYKMFKNLPLKILFHIYMQFMITLNLIKSKKVNIWIFFLDSHALLLPVIFAKLMNKKIIFALTSSLQKSAKAQKDTIANVLIYSERFNYNLADCIIIHSENLKYECSLERFDTKLSIAYEYFLDFEQFQVLKPYNERANLIGYVGRLSEEKGILNFVTSIPEILTVKKDVQFLIAGDGPLRNEIEKYIENADLSDRVKIIGWIPHEELLYFLNKLNLLVIPSFTESGPIIALEAMACGTPILATKVGHILNIIEDGKNGFILENNSPSCICKNVIRVMNLHNLEEIIDNAKKLVECEFTYDSAVKNYLAAFSRF